MAKAVSVILNLRDNASKGLIGVANRTKGVSKEMKGATRTVVSWKNTFTSSLAQMSSKAVKWSAVTTGAIAAFAAKTGFSEAIDLEGYRTQLETATKDTEKAASIMQYAIDLANKTPFEGGQMVEAASKFEAMGMSAKQWLTLTGDMAAATNKDMDQATEALIDAQTGELERLKEFGITKAMILEQGEKMFHGVQIANNKGQITDQQKFNEALVALMKDKYSGGMERQATTLKGVFSTITGITKSALAKIAGMNEDGSVRAGSAFDIIRNKAVELSEKLQQWQSDGTLDSIAQKFTEFTQKALDFAGNAAAKLMQAFDWISQHSEGVKTALTVLGIAFAAFKIVGFIGNVVYVVHTLSEFSGMLGVVAKVAGGGLLKGLTAGAGAIRTFGAGVIGIIIKIGAAVAPVIASLVAGLGSLVAGLASTAVAAIAAAAPFLGFIAIGVAVCAIVALVSKKIREHWDDIKTGVSNTVDRLKEYVVSKWTKFTNIISATVDLLKTSVVNKFNAIRDGIVGAFNTVKSKVAGVFDWFSSKFSWISDKLSWLRGAVSNLPGVGSTLSALGIGENASGTPYWRGGLTRINERGGEIVDLPSGTRIIPHDVSKKQASGGRSVVVNLTVQGNVIGNREYMEQTGEYVVNKIIAAMDIA